MMAGVGGGAQLDLLSHLPDALLVSILSRLQLDDATRCSVLSSHWHRQISPLLLLNFRASMPRHRDVIQAANSVLVAHPTAPVRSFCIRWNIRGGGDDTDDGGLLHELERRGVQELTFLFDDRCQRIPASVLAWASLTRLKASSGAFPDTTTSATPLNLPRLAEIDLFGVTISSESLHAVLSHCTALERLRIHGTSSCSSSCTRFHVRSPSLKVLDTDGGFDELFIEDAPNLEWVYGRYMNLRARCQRGVHLKVVHAPKLELLGYLGMSFHEIEIGETIFTKDRIHVKTLMPSLKTLAIQVSYTCTGYINWIVQLLKLFPFLQTLYIKSDAWSVVQAAARESWDLLRDVPCPCVDNHLEKVVFEVYRGHEWQREMAKFLHERSRFLRVMEFHCLGDGDGIHKDYGKPPSKEWVRKQQELLCLDSRASRDARFLFFRSQLVCNHFSVCDDEWYKGKYYDDLYQV
ncbi:unnamed protein product [Urochloa decumbens]|uniref:F-box domain-containing protein n=1 Tax=Urochloa decumbens TaxID=240449 RepID=A0ABC8YWB7_9POAL